MKHSISTAQKHYRIVNSRQESLHIVKEVDQLRRASLPSTRINMTQQADQYRRFSQPIARTNIILQSESESEEEEETTINTVSTFNIPLQVDKLGMAELIGRIQYRIDTPIV